MRINESINIEIPSDISTLNIIELETLARNIRKYFATKK